MHPTCPVYQAPTVSPTILSRTRTPQRWRAPEPHLQKWRTKLQRKEGCYNLDIKYPQSLSHINTHTHARRNTIQISHTCIQTHTHHTTHSLSHTIYIYKSYTHSPHTHTHSYTHTTYIKRPHILTHTNTHITLTHTPHIHTTYYT